MADLIIDAVQLDEIIRQYSQGLQVGDRVIDSDSPQLFINSGVIVKKYVAINQAGESYPIFDIHWEDGRETVLATSLTYLLHLIKFIV